VMLHNQLITQGLMVVCRIAYRVPIENMCREFPSQRLVICKSAGKWNHGKPDGLDGG
jgi:hypothetical protein